MSSSGQTTLTTTNSITLNFSPSSNLLTKYYTIKARPVNGGPSIIQKFDVSTTTYTIVGLTSNTTYSFTMTASSEYGQSNPSTALVTSTLPDPPSPLTVIATYNSLNVNLTQSYGSIYSYLITSTPTLGGSTKTNIILGNLNSSIITDLSSCTYYNISAIANSTTGLSSNPATILALTTPAVPTNLSASTPTISTISISFTAYSANVNYFIVTAIPLSGSTISQSFNFPASSYIITGLVSATPYNISLVAINSGGTSPTSSTLLYSTIPVAPTGLSLTSITTTTATIAFTAPSGTLTGYTVSAVDASGVAITPQSFNVPASSYTITGLTPAKNYTLSLVANVANGSSASVSLSSVYTLPNAPTNLTFTSSTTTSITFSFTAPSGNISIYTVSAIDASGVAITPQTFNAPASSYTITGLSAGKVYTVSLTATNVTAISAASSSVLLTTKNVEPTGLTLVSTTSSTAYFTFTPPSGLVTSYTATAVPTTGTTITQNFNAPASSYTITGLASATTYTITLTDTNNGGTSAASTSITALTIPLPPTGLTGTSATNNSITFSFTPSTGTINSYTVTAIDTNSNIVTQSFAAPASTYTITGLPYTASSVSYTISLTATNASGTSVSSNTLTYSKLATSIPNIPTGLISNGNTSTTILISWNSTTDTSITNYTARAIDSSGNTIIQNINAPANSYTITGLPEAKYYTVTISATNISGTSNYSTGISANTYSGIFVFSNYTTSTINGNYTIFAYKTSGVTYTNTITFTGISATIYILAVAGGGSGGCDQSAGGGGGGVLQSTISLTSNDNISLYIGNGAVANVASNISSNGQNTTVNFSVNSTNNINAVGGGGGQSYGYQNRGQSYNGGSGGGGYNTSGGNSGNTGQGIIGQGNNGGATRYGGGGGAGAVGGTPTSGGGNGGDGIKCTLPGIAGSIYENLFWGGGGGGGWCNAFSLPGGPGGNGGKGGGGGGSSNSYSGGLGDTNCISSGGNGSTGTFKTGGNGGTNTGGGGGGSSQGYGAQGGTGGSGILLFIVRNTNI